MGLIHYLCLLLRKPVQSSLYQCLLQCPRNSGFVYIYTFILLYFLFWTKKCLKINPSGIFKCRGKIHLLSSRPYSCSLIFKARSRRSRCAAGQTEDQHGPTFCWWTYQTNTVCSQKGHHGTRVFTILFCSSTLENNRWVLLVSSFKNPTGFTGGETHLAKDQVKAKDQVQFRLFI